MNERIMKLSDEAYVYASEKNSIYSPQLLRDYTERFAELIVRECIEQCNKKDPRPDRYSDWEEFAESRKVRECITSIKEHFGVE